jgi:hypothetical protein
MMQRRSTFVAAAAAVVIVGCAGTMLGQYIAQRDAISAAADDYPCPRHKIREISDNADPHERHWVYVLSVCGVLRAYRDRAATGGFDFVEIPLPADAGLAGPAPLVLPKRAAEEDSDEDDDAAHPPGAGAAVVAAITDASAAEH